MEPQASKGEIIAHLRKELLSLQGVHATAGGRAFHSGLGAIDRAFADQSFPTGAVHEFLSNQPHEAAATSGFMAALTGRFMKQGGRALWIGTARTLSPAALPLFGIPADQLLFIDLRSEKEALWVMEEALRCNALQLVIGEVRELTFTQSRRLQLAVEQSRVTGFIHRHRPVSEQVTACTTRWRIRPLPSMPEDGLPGVGAPRWQVQLLKCRNGRPGAWEVEWKEGLFRPVSMPAVVFPSTSIVQAG